jgi:polyhydroxyalkanoate synthesis regulator phasin
MDKETKNEFQNLARMIKTGFDEVGTRLENLETGQEEIKRRLDNVAYRFELDDLERRVEKLEFKAGLAKP